MSITFGKRVIGEEAHAKAVAAQKGGAEVFGKRVRGALSVDNPDHVAKAASEFGPRTTGKAHASDTKGGSGDVSVEDLKKLLDTATGNPTLFDSLYENELARSGGPRKAALEVFREVERGIKGAGRMHVLAEINTLLGLDVGKAEREAQNVADQQDVYAQMEERNEENKQLRDLPRLRALRERSELLKEAKSSSSKGTRSQVADQPLTVEGQIKKLHGEDTKPAEQKSSDHPTDTTDTDTPTAAAKGDGDSEKKSSGRKSTARTRK